jgi:hypothetical protein
MFFSFKSRVPVFLYPVFLYTVFLSWSVFLWSASVTFGQDSSAQKSSQPDVLAAGGRAGAGAYPDSNWAATEVTVSNDSDEDAEVEAIVYFKTAPNMRFVRRFWIPPRAIRRVLIPIFVNELPPGVGFRNTIVIVKDTKTNSPIRGLGNREEHSLPLSKPLDEFVSMMPVNGAFVPIRSSESDDVDGLSALRGVLIPNKSQSPNSDDGLQALRYGQNRHIQYTAVYLTELPDFYLAFDAVDQMVISDNSLRRDGGGAAAVREWLALGGQLWLMLDQLEEQTVAAVFGGDLPFQIIDRVTLTEFELTSTDSAVSRRVDSETVVPFTRVLVDPDVQVLSRIDEWPAAILVPRGKGQILITTIGMDAWLTKNNVSGTSGRNNSGRQTAQPSFYPGAELRDAGQYLLQTQEPAVQTGDFQTYLNERVGYVVVSGRTVGAILVSFVAALLLAGLILRRRQRLAYMLLVAPILVGVTIGVLFMLGANRGSIPRTVGAIQWIRIFPEVREASVEGQIALYHPTRSELEVGAVGGMYSVDMSGQQLIEKRLRWTDRNSFEWDKMELPGGLRFADWGRPLYFNQPPRAQARFGDEDMSGMVIDSAWDELEDAIILFPLRPPLPVDIHNDGSLTVRSGAALGEGQFVAGKLLTDEQRRRQNLVKTIHARRPKSGFPERPVLMAWSSGEPEGLTVHGEARRFQSSLITIPINFIPPEPGAAVTVAHSFIPVQTTMSPLGEGQASVFDSKFGKWIDLATPTSAWLRFQLPKELSGIEVDSAEVVLDLSVPSRNVEFRTYRAGQVVAQGEKASPAGPQTFRLTSSEDFDVDDEGGILFGVRISDAETEDERKPVWKIIDVRMTVKGRMPQ